MSALEEVPHQLTGAFTTGSVLGLVAASAAVGAVGGIVTSAGVALYSGIAARRSPTPPPRSEVATEGLAEVGAGAVLGAVGAAAAALSGAGLAALLGRNVLSVVLPGVIGALAAAAMREPAIRASREATAAVIRRTALKPALPPSA